MTNSTCMWNLKYDTNKPIYDIKTDSQTRKTDLWLLTGMGQKRIESLGLADANYFIYRLDKQQRFNYIAQGTIFNIL